MTTPTHSKWTSIARRTRRKVNIGWAMEFMALPLILSCILATTTIVLLRRYSLNFDSSLTLSIVLPLLILLGAAFAIRSKKRHESDADAFVRLESSMALHSSLTAASKGKTSWPVVPEKITSGIRWNYPRLLLPLVGAIILIIAAFVVPIQAQIPELPKSAPQAWDKLTSDLDDLKQKDLVQQEYIEQMEEKLDELKEQPQKDWFSHPSLEATENLKRNHAKELKKLSSNLDKAEKSLNTLKKYSQQLTEAQKNKLKNQFNNAMEAMEKGNLKPNKELLEQLKKIDPNMLNSLTPEQMQQLQDSMNNMSEEMKKQLRDALNGKENPSGEGEQEGEGGPAGESSEHGDGNPHEFGEGDPRKGPGHAPKILGSPSPDLKPGDMQKLKPKNLKNALPGDLLETTEGGEHKVDKSKSKQQSGGKTDHKGQGGSEVWKNNYLPKEKRALKNFFK